MMSNSNLIINDTVRSQMREQVDISIALIRPPTHDIVSMHSRKYAQIFTGSTCQHYYQDNSQDMFNRKCSTGNDT